MDIFGLVLATYFMQDRQVVVTLSPVSGRLLWLTWQQSLGNRAEHRQKFFTLDCLSHVAAAPTPSQGLVNRTYNLVSTPARRRSTMQ